MLLMKRKEHFHATVEDELELLRGENVKLRDSLVMQSSVLEREKKEKEVEIELSRRTSQNTRSSRRRTQKPSRGASNCC